MVAVLALSASVMFGLSDFIGGTMSRSINPIRVLIVGQAAAATAVIPLFFLVGQWPTAAAAYLWPLLAGVATSCGLVMFYRALATGTMGVVAPISATSVVVPIIGGLALGESIAVPTLVGIVLLVAGTVVAARPKSGAIRSSVAPSSAIWAVLAALLFGIAIFSLAQGGKFSISVTMIIATVVPLFAFFLVCAALRIQPFLPARQLVAAASTGVLGLVANWLLTTASASGQITVVAVLASLYPAVTALLARWLHHERLSTSQLIGSTALLIGIFVIVLT